MFDLAIVTTNSSYFPSSASSLFISYNRCDCFLSFFLPIFIYITSFILHLVLKLFGSISSSFQTRLAMFWSLAISALIFLSVSVIKIFTNGSIELVIITFSELIVVYIFSRVLGFVCNFRDRNLFTFVMISFYLTPVILINFS